jgi:hypothetical protein
MAMTSLLLIEVGAPLVQADTVVTVASRDVFDIVYAAAAGAFVILLLVLIVALLGALAQFRAGVRGMQRAVSNAREAVLKDEAVQRIRETAGHVEAMAGTLRTETERAGDSIRKVSEQVDLASRRMEERIEEFNALMAVVQDEAEETFLDTASTARGMRAGFGELTRKAERRRREIRGRDNGSTRPLRPAPPPASADPPSPTPGDGGNAPLFPADAGDRTPPSARHPHDEETP